MAKTKGDQEQRYGCWPHERPTRLVPRRRHRRSGSRSVERPGDEDCALGEARSAAGGIASACAAAKTPISDRFFRAQISRARVVDLALTRIWSPSMKPYYLAALLLLLSTAFALASGLSPGRLEDAAAHSDQAVLTKVTAIKETPIFMKLKDGTQGPLLTTRRDYTLEVSRVLAGPERKPGVVTYQMPQFVRYDENGKVVMTMWLAIPGTGKESHLEQGQEYVLCLRQGGEGQPPSIVRAEPANRAAVVTTAMHQAQCWAALKAAFTAEEFKSVRLVAFDAASDTLVVMIPSPPRPELGRNDSPRARLYAVTPAGAITCAREFDTYSNYNHLYFDGKTVILRASNEYTMVFPHEEFAARVASTVPATGPAGK